MSSAGVRVGVGTRFRYDGENRADKAAELGAGLRTIERQLPAERVLRYERGGGVDDRLLGGTGMPAEQCARFAAVDKPFAAEFVAQHRHLRAPPCEQLDGEDVQNPAAMTASSSRLS